MKQRHRQADISPLRSIGSRLAILNETGDRRFWLSARALVLRTAGHQPLAIRDMRRVNVGERRSHAHVKSWQALSFLVATAMFHSEEGTPRRSGTILREPF